MLPANWKATELGEIAKFSSGGTPSKENTDFWGGIHPWVTAKDLKQHYLKNSIDTLTDAGLANAKLAPAGASLILVRGMTLLKDFPVGYVTQPMSFNQDIKALIPEKSVDGLFLSFFLASQKERMRQLVSIAGHGTGRLDTESIKTFPVNLPSLCEQKKIARILSTWDQAISATEKLLANSQQQKSALTQELLMGRKRFNPFINSEDYFQAKYGLLPSDWSFLPLSDLAKEVVERNSSGINFPVLSCSKHRGFVDSLEYFKKQVFGEDTTNYKIIEYGSFGFPSNHIEEGSIGYQNICEKGMVSPIYTVFKTNEKIDDGYLYKILKTDHYRQIFAASTNASVDRRGSLRWKEFSTIRVPVPSLEEQKQISSIIEDADREVENYQRQLSNLQMQKKALMQQLLTGKRRVKVDES